MTRRSREAGLGLVIGALVLIAMIPKELWKLFGVGVFFAIIPIIFFAAMKLLGAKPSAPASAPKSPRAHEPTLAELTTQAPSHPAHRGRSSVPTPRASGLSPPPPLPTPHSTQRSSDPNQGLSQAGPVQPPATARDHLAAAQESIHVAERAHDVGIEESKQLAESLSRNFAAATKEPALGAVTPPLRPSPATLPQPVLPHPVHDSSGDKGFYAPPVVAAPSTVAAAHTIPATPDGYGDGRWVPAGEAVTVTGVRIAGGMLYVGARLPAANGQTDPCLVSAHLPIAAVGSFRHEQLGYWPSFATISPSQRRAYLNWLAEGRSDPACEIGFVFLYFYALERRVLLDTTKDGAVKAEWPAIASELRRLLAIYGESSASFRRYADDLLKWIALEGLSTKLYNDPLPAFVPGYEMPFHLRYALGQAALDRAPLPAALALAWLRHTPGLYLRTAATRCPDEFGALFCEHYVQTFGAGLVLSKNRTKLKIDYRPASSGFNGITVSVTFGEVPDVVALTAPLKRLQELAERCTDELGSFSRLLGKDPTLKGTLEASLLLPASLWPDTTRRLMEALSERARHDPVTLTLDELAIALGTSQQALTRDRLRAVAWALESTGLGLEPDVLGGSRTPGSQDPVVVFRMSAPDAQQRATATYQTAALTLQLAAACACADGHFHTLEIALLKSEIDSWTHLVPTERERLHAHLQYLIAAPPTLAGLRTKLALMPAAAKESLATLMATLVQTDGVVTPEEVKFLEKAYRVLGVETARVFSDVHAAGSAPAGGASKGFASGFRLDKTRIAALQRDTEHVSALLSKIFTEETPPEAEPEAEPSKALGAPSVWALSLDDPHTVFAQLLLSRAQWTRSELEDAAADLDLMLDGALEQINDAAFDAFDAPLCEGDETVDVNTELLEKLAP